MHVHMTNELQQLRIKVQTLENILDQIAAGGPIGVRIATQEALRAAEREATGKIVRFKNVDPTEWRETALGAHYHYSLTRDQVLMLLGIALGFPSEGYSVDVLAGSVEDVKLLFTVGQPYANP
jgi:hypothetical protein